MGSGYYGGCDVGSTTAKAVIMDDRGIVGSSIVPSEIDPEESAKLALERAIREVDGLDRLNDLVYLVGTGYGRTQVPFANKNISEISCHARGAFHCDPKVRTIVDIGGQDIKGISMKDDGSVLDFMMNDKCAAGTGKFFEAMSRTFKTDLQGFSALSLKAGRSISITSQCSVFAESEAISLIAKRHPPEEIALGIQESVAQRCYALLRRVGLREKVAISGGCAKNDGLVRALTTMMKLDIARFSMDPQLMGALGACVFAREAAR